DKMMLLQAQENGVALDEEQLLFIAGGQDNVVNEDVDEQPVQDLALTVDNVFQANDCDAFDSDIFQGSDVSMGRSFFGALCYPTNDSEDLGKLQPTADIGIFIGYAPSRKGYRIYNKRT
ncbi:hypothetical protein Tco_1347720, partial [Tanacetum coccineum]